MTAADVSIGWLVDGASDGRIPDPGVVSPRVRATAELIVSLDQTHTVSASHCETLAPNRPTAVRAGQQIVFTSRDVRVGSVVNGREIGSASYNIAYGPRLTALRGPLTISVTPSRDSGLQLCAED